MVLSGRATRRRSTHPCSPSELRAARCDPRQAQEGLLHQRADRHVAETPQAARGHHEAGGQRAGEEPAPSI